MISFSNDSSGLLVLSKIETCKILLLSNLSCPFVNVLSNDKLNHLLFENYIGKPGFVLNYVCSSNNMWYCHSCQVLLASRVNCSGEVKIQQLAVVSVLE